MTTIALHSRRTIGLVWSLFLEWWSLVFVVACIACGIFGAYRALDAWHRGIYAGFHYNDARAVAINVLVTRYGKDTASGFRFANPPVVNSHSRSLFVDGQIRIFHLIGRSGTRYCISVWHPRILWTGDNATGIDIGGDYTFKKGCKF